MRAKQLAARRQRNADLARMDAANRCVVCKRAFNETGRSVEDFCVPGKCCSDDCLNTLLARARPETTMKTEGWRYTWHRWHYYRAGASLCGKFGVSIIGGREPRRPWPATVPLSDLDRVCQACESARTLGAVDLVGERGTE